MPSEEKTTLQVVDLKLYTAYSNYINSNSDRIIKVVGDRIVLWDLSGLTLPESNQDYKFSIREAKILTKSQSIVIDAGIKLFSNDDHFELDIIIWNKKLGKIFHTSSKFCRIYVA